MTFGLRKYHPDPVQPAQAGSDSDAHRAELQAYAKAGGAESIKAVAAHFGMPSGRKWAEISMREIEMLWKYTLGKEPLPDPEGIVWTSDESEEGRAFNARIPF